MISSIKQKDKDVGGLTFGVFCFYKEWVMNLTGKEVAQMQSDYVMQSWAKSGGATIPVAKAEGIYFWDFDGKKYADMSSLLVCSNLGHQNKVIVEAIKAQADKMCFMAPAYASEPKSKLAKMLTEIAGADTYKRVFFTNGGAESNENAIKMAKIGIYGAYRMLSITSINRVANKVTDELASHLGTTLFQTSAHIGARPSHADWQGGVYTTARSGSEVLKYRNLEDYTGYGRPDGLGGVNCRHTKYPFIEGVSQTSYTEQDIYEMNNAMVDFGGIQMTAYQATQYQRYLESGIRSWVKKDVVYNTEATAQKVNEWSSRLTEFTNATGRYYDKSRTYNR